MGTREEQGCTTGGQRRGSPPRKEMGMGYPAKVKICKGPVKVLVFSVNIPDWIINLPACKAANSMPLAAPQANEEHYWEKSSYAWWMAQPGKVLAAKPDNPSLMPETHIVGKKRVYCYKMSSDLYRNTMGETYPYACIYMQHTHTHTNKIK